MMTMRKNILKRIAVMAFAAAITVAGLPIMAPAANVPTISEKDPVSLTITKYEAGEGDNTDLDGNVTGVQQTVTGRTPMEGVDFTAVKFATLIQESDGSSVRLQYSLTTVGAELLTKAAGQTGGSGKTYAANDKVDIDTLKNFIANRTARGPVFTDIEKKADAVTGTTDENGVVKFTSEAVADGNESLKHIDGQGLYLVVETKAPDTVTKRAHPFFVSLPMSDRTNLNSWLYDVYAYPKNTTGAFDLQKQIESINGSDAQGVGNIAAGKHSAEADIGDTITYSVNLTMAIPDGGLKKLGIVDTMCPGLTFKKADNATDPDVIVKRKADSDEFGPIDKANYTVTTKVNDDGTTTINVNFTNAYIATLNSSDNKLPQFEFVYNAVLNEKAVLGTIGNDNTVKAVYRTNAQADSEPDKTTDEKKTKTYTWGINLLKVGEKDVALADVEFKLSNDAGKTYKFVQSEPGVYVPSDATGASEILKTASNGKIQIKGLKSDVYSLAEVKTAKGYVLLKNPVEITITGNNTDGSATATINGKAATLSDVTVSGVKSNTALVEVKIVNSRGFLLPSTGGKGTTMFTVVGIAVISISAALLIIMRRKAKSEK